MEGNLNWGGGGAKISFDHYFEGRKGNEAEGGAYSELRGAEAIFSHSPQYHASHGEIDGIYKIGTRPTIFKMRFRKDTI